MNKYDTGMLILIFVLQILGYFMIMIEGFGLSVNSWLALFGGFVCLVFSVVLSKAYESK
jgi:type IV secretory pathway TrbL component